jgi:hypothetical protein
MSTFQQSEARHVPLTGAYPFRSHDRALALLIKLRKDLPETNNLAYFVNASATMKKSCATAVDDITFDFFVTK